MSKGFLIDLTVLYVGAIVILVNPSDYGAAPVGPHPVIQPGGQTLNLRTLLAPWQKGP